MSTLGFQRLKVVALAAEDLPRAERFYGETLGLPAAYEDGRQVGFMLAACRTFAQMPKIGQEMINFGAPTQELQLLLMSLDGSDFA